MGEVKKMLMFMLDLQGKRITIIGAGQVGARKVKFLMESGADVRVIGTEIDVEIKVIPEIELRTMEVTKSNFKSMIDGSFMVVVATDDTALNRKISKYAREKGILVNVVDDPEACDVYFPSLISRGALVIGIGTSGASPSLSRYTRERIETAIGPEFGLMVELHEQVRSELKDKIDDLVLKRELLRKILDSDEIWAHLKDNRIKEASKLAKELIKR